MNLQENISLKEFSTFKTGGPARYFAVVKTIEELQEAVRFSQEHTLKIFVVGGGSNILISDAGFPGLVIKIEIAGIEIQSENQDGVEIKVGAGENWDHFVEYCVSHNFAGVENLSYIPGTVGAAPVQNIGAYGAEVKNVISYVEVYDTENLEIKKLSRLECEFNYRDSIFKKEAYKKYIITHVGFSLIKTTSFKFSLNTSYKDISEYIKNNNLSNSEITLQKIRDIVIDIRKKKLPDVWQPDAPGTAGSFFKNPIIRKEAYTELLKTYPDMPHFPSGNDVKIPAAWLLDKVCGFKGYREEDVGVYQNQALVLVNFGNATTQEILNLAEKMIACVKEKTKIILEKEVQIIS